MLPLSVKVTIPSFRFSALRACLPAFLSFLRSLQARSEWHNWTGLREADGVHFVSATNSLDKGYMWQYLRFHLDLLKIFDFFCFSQLFQLSKP